MTHKRKRLQTRVDPARPSTPKPAPTPPRSESEKEHLDQMLDDALAATFPASDPVAVIEPSGE